MASMITADQYCRLVEQEFRFLVEEYGYSVDYPDPLPMLPKWLKGFEVDFRNRTTGVQISLQIPEQLPTIFIRRLDATEGRQNAFSLGLLLMMRAPELNPLKDEISLPLAKGIEQLIQEYAMALKSTAADILASNFEIFPLLQKEQERLYQLRKSSSTDRFVYF